MSSGVLASRPCLQHGAAWEWNIKGDWHHPSESPEATEARRAMVDRQLVSRGIRDARVLQAFRMLPRHLFCPPGTALESAYGDHPLPIGYGQTISQPYMVAAMTEALRLGGAENTLEIGTGSGYQAAILALLAGEVNTVERIEPLAEAAGRTLRSMGFNNVAVHLEDGTRGWPQCAPFDRIVVTAAAPHLPEPLKQQLADGGVMAIPTGPRHLQELVLCTRRGSRFETRAAGGCRFVPLIGEHGWPD